MAEQEKPTMTNRYWLLTPTVVGLIFGCSEYVPLGDLPGNGTGGSAGDGVGGTGGATGTGGVTGGTGGVTGGVGGVGGSVMAGAAGAPPVTGGVGGSAGAGGGSGGLATGGTAGSVDPSGGVAGTDIPMGGMAGTGNPTGGMAGTGAEAGGGGTAGSAGAGPYDPRTGSFKVLAYSNTEQGFTHTQAINAGKPMLMAMGTKQGFEVTFTSNPSDINAQNLAQYELVFGLNPTGIGLTQLNPSGKADFEEWMTTKNGAFAGVHSSTDHEAQWSFWWEVVGQNYNGHDVCCSQQNIQWEASASTFIAVAGLPSPWPRAEEWYLFNTWEQWSAKPGFKILSKVTTNGRTRPVSYIREWGNFRSFYTSLGHEQGPYSDANFIKHVAAGLMWAARREALFKP
jgi:type 1 glutamine amidotransferase